MKRIAVSRKFSKVPALKMVQQANLDIHPFIRGLNTLLMVNKLLKCLVQLFNTVLDRGVLNSDVARGFYPSVRQCAFNNLHLLLLSVMVKGSVRPVKQNLKCST